MRTVAHVLPLTPLEEKISFMFGINSIFILYTDLVDREGVERDREREKTTGLSKSITCVYHRDTFPLYFPINGSKNVLQRKRNSTKQQTRCCSSQRFLVRNNAAQN